MRNVRRNRGLHRSPITSALASPASALYKRRPMPNRIDQKFAALRETGGRALIAYISAGDPHLAATRELALAFDRAGVDVLELGVPFSDPLADGVVNQMAAIRALAAGTTVV